MDDIKLPLKKGTLSDIEAAAPTSSQDDAMEVDEPTPVILMLTLEVFLKTITLSDALWVVYSHEMLRKSLVNNFSHNISVLKLF